METPARPAAERLDQYGYNRPPEAHRRGPLARKPAAGEVDTCVRTSPEHQLRLVEAWQPLHGVVAMTGAGVAYFRVADSLGQPG